MAQRGRPRNPDCDECGGPTNRDFDYQDEDGCEHTNYTCRSYRNCAGATLTTFCRCGDCY